MVNFRDIILAIVPQRIAAEMEAESRLWMRICAVCGTCVSIWDSGGIRWLAKGKPVRLYYCGLCGRKTKHEVSKVTLPILSTWTD
ncbi:hypothetical protein A2G06_16780 (plasmid) [Geobacter anodireducens]|nr:hypothetical protein A2G06_16780 [Geobacter anodireducens]